MPGLGTIVNVIAIVVGGIAGLLTRQLLKDRYQETITKSLGFAVVVMALASTLSKMLVVNITGSGSDIKASLDTQGTMMMIVSLAVGALLGEICNLEYWFERFGGWLRDKTGSHGDSQFISAFVTASLTVCIGAMAIIGSIQDGMSGDHSTLFVKAILDLIIIMMLTASLGKGCIFSAIPVAIFQGAITALSGALAGIMTDAALDNITLVGNVLILCVGVNLIWPKTLRVANLLPAIIIAVLFTLV